MRDIISGKASRADIDPRESELTNCFTISDKARSIAGSVLEAVSAFEHGVKSY